jgi:hypothetical protein
MDDKKKKKYTGKRDKLLKKPRVVENVIMEITSQSSMEREDSNQPEVVSSIQTVTGIQNEPKKNPIKDNKYRETVQKILKKSPKKTSNDQKDIKKKVIKNEPGQKQSQEKPKVEESKEIPTKEVSKTEEKTHSKHKKHKDKSKKKEKKHKKDKHRDKSSKSDKDK